MVWRFPTTTASYFEERGLKEDSHGKIVTERGRIVSEVGFARAARKVLGDATAKLP